MEKSTPERSSSENLSCYRPSLRRASSVICPREELPTALPDPGEIATNSENASSETIFEYPSPEFNHLPAVYQSLLNYAAQEQEFYRSLNEIIANDCPKCGHTFVGSKSETFPPVSVQVTHADDQECHCERMRRECEEFIAPLNSTRSASSTAALVAYGAVKQLTRLYSLWDRYLDMENQLQQQKERLRYVNMLQEKLQTTEKDVKSVDPELDQSIGLLNTILASGNSASLKRSQLKQQRERSKSVVNEEATHYTLGRTGYVKSSASCNFGQKPLRRESTYSEGKSKVSKWTKVKAAFKWEKANVPALNESHKEVSNAVGLTPVNNEVARYLRVPSVPCGGGSSADSILSSSSGHFFSESGTPGTVSSASSIDDIDNTGKGMLRRDSSSYSRSETRKHEDNDFNALYNSPSGESPFEIDSQNLLRSDSSKSNATTPAKSSSNKSIRRSKIVPDFEALPENAIAEIRSTPSRRLKPPPSPLDLDLKQDLNDLDSFYSPHNVKSPQDGTQSLNRIRKIGSPGNSSVPSSPSRYSEFFPEFESEDISSGDISEPPSPSRKTFQQKQAEINQKYLLLCSKLDMEFREKRREWEKMKANPNFRAIPRMNSAGKCEELSPNQSYNSNLSAKMLEENLSPDFKKKLRKWRVKKQSSIQSCNHQPSVPPTASPSSPNKNCKDMTCESKSKIDWNLWMTGEIKLDGQGLMPLPEKKNLPEDFQKKLEQWNKIKGDRCYLADRDKKRDKHKSHDKEKFPKLKAIVGDHPTKAKEIEVKTSAGVMKFEGISRKFTRKLYEWEKARGIGPESSTFALLHPGYCPIDVGRIPKDNKKTDNSPTLSRSLSLDSVSPNFTLPSVLSHQASSLSLNDMKELKSEMDGVSSSDPLGDSEFKKFDEPEAVMVEVEDHIVETASPLITANTRIERQTPVYKYEEIVCNDICNTRRIQSFESHTNLAPLLSALKRFDEIFDRLKGTAPEINEREEVRRCNILITSIRNIYPYYTENLIRSNVLNAISDVQSELSRIAELCQKSPLDEACCQEILQERNMEYIEEFNGLHESLKLLRQSIQGGKSPHLRRNIVPDINITADDNCDEASLQYTVCDTTSRDQLSTTLEATDELSTSQVENDTETTTTTTTHTAVQRSFSNATANGSMGKKKLRLRKMGSRQNSKTESSNSSDEDVHHTMETPRRLKRKIFRFKQRSFDDDFRRREEPNKINEDARCLLKLKPLNAIEKRDNWVTGLSKSCTKLTQAPREKFTKFSQVDGQEVINAEVAENDLSNANSNVFVKTRRKVFRTIEEPIANDGITVVIHDLNDNAVNETLPDKEQTITNGIDKSESNGENRIKYIRESCTVETWTTNNRRKSKRKSLSESDLRNVSRNDFMEERRCHSADRMKRISKIVRQPLASDSFKKINRNSNVLMHDDSNSGTQTRMELRFRKNPDLYFIQHSKVYNPRVVRKIENRIAKSNSGASVQSNTPDSNFHRNKRIFERKSMTPTLHDMKMEFPTGTLPSPLNSVPTTPVQEIQAFNKPCTPLSERARRLQKAKEEFLLRTLPHPKPSIKRRDQSVSTKTSEQRRCSDHSLSSTSTTTATGGADDHNGDVLKSASVNTIRGSSIYINDTPTTQSDAGTDVDICSGGLYDSLPRSVSRSGKISSKLGFAALASKFRRSKRKSKSKETSSNDSAISALCRRTLFADVVVAPYDIQQSLSTPQAHVSPSLSPTQASSSLNKSQSEQYVKHSQKESYV